MPKNTVSQKVIRAAEEYVRNILASEGTGHDWYHIDRVRKMGVRIAKQEKVDASLVELMALLHELPDHKIVGFGNEDAALENIKTWLLQQNVSTELCDIICYVIKNQSYSASGVRGEKLTSPEGRVMQDADRLEALGAIGIARVFAYGGKTHRLLYNPTEKPRKRVNAKQYKAVQPSSVTHFYEKLFKLRDLMNTKTGRRIATQRHRFMEKFLEEFFAEWKSQK